MAQILEMLDLRCRAPKRGGQLFDAGRPPELRREGLAFLGRLPQQQLDVNGQTDRPGLIRERPHHRLSNPPGRVGRKARPSFGKKFPGSLEQAYVAFFDEIEDRKSAVEI